MMKINPIKALLVFLLPIFLRFLIASVFQKSDRLQEWIYLFGAALPFVWTYITTGYRYQMNILNGVGPWWVGLVLLHMGVVYWKFVNWYIVGFTNHSFLYHALALVLPIGLVIVGFPCLYNYIISKNFSETLAQAIPSTKERLENAHDHHGMYKKLIISCLFNNLMHLNAEGKINPFEFSVLLHNTPAIVEDVLKTNLDEYIAELRQKYNLQGSSH